MNSAAKIEKATLELLRSGGPSAATIEAVAARSGVARTTVYRRFRNREEMLRAALLSVAVPESFDDDFSTSDERLRWVIRTAASMVFTGIGFGGFATLLTESDPEFVDSFREVLAVHRAVVADVLLRGVAVGQVRDEIDPDVVIDTVVGALAAEKARSGQISKDWEGRMAAALAPLVRTTEKRG